MKSEFLKNVLKLMTGTTVSQLIALALIPVLARMFSPEEMGQLTYFTSLIMFVSVVATGRYDQAIVLPKEDKDAINLVALSFFILCGTVALTSLIILISYNWLIQIEGFDKIGIWIWLIPLTIFFKGIHGIFSLWSNRKKRFGKTSWSNVGLTMIRSIVQVFGGFERNSAEVTRVGKGEFFTSLFDKSYTYSAKGISTVGLSYLYSSISAGFFVSAVIVVFPFLRLDKHLLKQVNKSDIKKMAKKHRKFPLINSVHALTDELKNWGVNQSILVSFSDKILGFYGMTFRVLRAPMQFIGGAFSQVFYQRASEMRANEQSYVGLLKKTVSRLFLIALPIFIVIALFGPQLFSFVLGERWEQAGVYAQYMTPWLFANFVVSPIQNVAVITNNQEKIFVLTLVGNITIFGSIFLGGFVFKDIISGFILLSSLQVIYFVFVYLWILKIAKKDCANY